VLQLESGARRDIVLKLWPEGRISGVVTDERREPIVKATVHLLRRQSGFWRQVFSAVTDDRGAYAFGSLDAGEYAVLLPHDRIGEGPTAAVRQPVFAPGVPTIDAASVIALAAGAKRPDANILAGPPGSRLVSLSGSVTGLAPSQAPLTLRLVPEGAPTLEWTAPVAADGAFTFPELPTGSYRLTGLVFPDDPALVRASSRFDLLTDRGHGLVFPTAWKAPALIADLAISLRESMNDLAVPLRPAPSITGEVRDDPEAGPLPAGLLHNLPVLFRPVDESFGDIPVGGVRPDGTFTSIGLLPGRYYVSVGDSRLFARTGWYPGAIEVDGRPAGIVELGPDGARMRIVLTNRISRLSGLVRDASGRPVPGAAVIVFAQRPESWLNAPPTLFRADAQGRFEARMLRAGEHLVAAVFDLPDAWRTDEFLRSLMAIGVPVSFAIGDSQSVELRLGRE
jgi:hypothetical protein